jgi:hypothetical protein
MKSILKVVSENKGAIGKKALIVGGVVAGLFIGLKALTHKDAELEEDSSDEFEDFNEVEETNE